MKFILKPTWEDVGMGLEFVQFGKFFATLFFANDWFWNVFVILILQILTPLTKVNVAQIIIS